MANKWIHRLSNIDSEQMQADCAECGRVRVTWRKPNKYRCTVAVSLEGKRKVQNSKTKFLPRQIYFIKADNGLTKIGLSINLEERFRRLQADSPCVLTLLFTVNSDDAYTLEQDLHKQFAIYRRHGEWFFLSDSALAEIKKAHSQE